MEDNHYWPPKFNLRDSGLPYLASLVAIEIPSFPFTGKNEASMHLSKLLHDLTQGENPRANSFENRTVLAYAISGRERSKNYWGDRPLSEVLPQIKRIAEDLKNFKSLPQERQEYLEDFCTNLSNECVRHYDRFYSGQSRLAA